MPARWAALYLISPVTIAEVPEIDIPHLFIPLVLLSRKNLSSQDTFIYSHTEYKILQEGIRFNSYNSIGLLLG